MANILQLQDVAQEQFLSELKPQCSEEQAGWIENVAFKTAGLLQDSAAARLRLSPQQLQRLMELGYIDEDPPSRPRTLRGVVECIWRVGDPSVLSDNESEPPCEHPMVGQVIYHAVVIDQTKEVVGEWHPKWKTPADSRSV